MKYYTPSEYARVKNISYASVRKMIDNGTLKAVSATDSGRLKVIEKDEEIKLCDLEQKIDVLTKQINKLLGVFNI